MAPTPRAAPVGASSAAAEACVAVYGGRERARALLRAAFPKRRVRLVFVRSTAELGRVLRTELVDAVLVELGPGADDAWTAAALARDFPSAPFFGWAPLRASGGALLARCASIGLADVLVDGVDDAALRSLVSPHLFTARFAGVFGTPPPELGLTTPLQLGAWARVVEGAGRLARTSPIAASLGVTREHLSRTFGEGAPPLKAVVDLVRVIVAAELARNPGHQVRDIAAVLGFATPSHLARAAARVAGRAPSALAGVSSAEIVAHFVARHAGGRRRGPRPGYATAGAVGPGAGGGGTADAGAAS